MKLEKPKLNNRALLNLLIILVIIAAVWLIGYFLGIDEGQQRIEEDLMKQETEQQAKADPNSPLPKLPTVSRNKVEAQGLPSMPK